MSATLLTEDIYHLLGIGAGPMNLAMAVASIETGYADPHAGRRVLFLDDKASFAWHPGMQIESSQMQTPFLKDLVSQYNPTSGFSFLNYLRHKGRLEEFINLRQLYPSRREYEDYLGWAVGQLGERVQFGWRVTSIGYHTCGAYAKPIFAVHATHAEHGERVFKAINLSLGAGLTPSFPFPAPQHDPRVIHSIRFASEATHALFAESAPRRILVVGAGQSSAEILMDLANRLPDTELVVMSRGFIYRVADASSFVNDMFTDDAAIRFAGLSPSARAHVLQDLRNSNYAAVDEALVQQLRQRLYDEKVAGRDRIALRSYMSVDSVESTRGGVEVNCTDTLTGARSSGRFCAVVCATGFSDAGARSLLEPLLAERARWSGNSGAAKQPAPPFDVDRDFVLTGLAPAMGDIYLQGYSDALIDTTIISNLGPRARRLMDRMCDGIQLTNRG